MYVYSDEVPSKRQNWHPHVALPFVVLTGLQHICCAQKEEQGNPKATAPHLLVGKSGHPQLWQNGVPTGAEMAFIQFVYKSLNHTHVFHHNHFTPLSE